MLAQTLLVKAGMPLPDPESVVPYSPDSTVAVLVKMSQQQPVVSDLANTCTDTSCSCSVPKLSNLSYAVVSRHNLLDLSSTSTSPMENLNSTLDKKDQDIIVLGEAHILDYDKYLQSLAAKNKSKVVLTQLTCQEIKDKTSCVPHWSQLDSYSSLEEARSVVEESENSSDTKAMKRAQSRYTLRERTRTYRMVRQCRSATSTVFYCNMCADTHSVVISGNNKKLDLD